MKIMRVDSYEGVADYLSRVLASRLELDQKVLWLLAGGSSIKVAVAVSKQLKDVPSLTNLTIMLTDERFGAVGHADSNWQQLLNSGFFLPKADLIPVLKGKNIEKTTNDFAHKLDERLRKSDFRLGLFGMGADGHTSGILPGSPALTSPKLADYYQGPDYHRITTTEKAIEKLDEAVLFAMGSEKHPAVKKLKTDISNKEQPAQILKKVSKFVVFTDCPEV